MRARTPSTILATVLSAALLTACGGGEPSADVTTPADDVATTAAPATAPPQTEAPTEAPTEAAGPRLEIEVRDGTPVGGVQQLSVSAGDEVTLVVTSEDTEDVVHVHGYDLHADLAPGSPAELTFTADIPGAFEIELEDAHVKLAELQVQP